MESFFGGVQVLILFGCAVAGILALAYWRKTGKNPFKFFLGLFKKD